MKFSILAVTLFLSTASFAQTSSDALQDDLLKVSNAVWTAVEQQNMAAMQTLTTPDFVFVGTQGILSGPELGKALQGCKLSSFKLTSPQLRKLSSNSAVLVYRADEDFACNGKPLEPVLLVSDTFIRKQGKWLTVVHSETEPAPAQ
jgi:hypothetical protein